MERFNYFVHCFICDGGPDLRRGTLIIDMGAGVTDFALHRQGFVAYTGVIPVGGIILQVI